MKVGVLCSGVGLGVYVPGLIIDRGLRRNNIKSEVFVLEDIIVDEKKEKIPKNREAYHKNFSVALLGLKISKDMTSSVCNEKLNNIINYWFKEKIRCFVVVSGFWLPIIETYRKRYSQLEIHCECIHIDSSLSASWTKVGINPDYCHNEFLYSYSEKKLLKDLIVKDEFSPILFKDRDDKLLIHGGGWGLGSYSNKVEEINKALIQLNIIAYDYSEIKTNDDINDYFIIDPKWQPWIKGKEGNHIFPPFSHAEGNRVKFISNYEYPDVYDLITRSKGIVSKPGGATLIDSLSAATPLIILEPFGDYEEKNGALWCSLGFGIYYEDFMKIYNKMELLEKLHKNILKEVGKRQSYISYLVDKLSKKREDVYATKY